MTDLTKLKELAERATPGPWRTGDGEESLPDCVLSGEFVICEHTGDDVDFIAAANPQAILGLISRLERAEVELEACAAALPYTNYMDPPDGGDVSVPEQLRRMAKDAARYRWLRSLPRHARHDDLLIMLCKSRAAPNNWMLETIRGELLDQAIDAALEGGGR